MAQHSEFEEDIEDGYEIITIQRLANTAPRSHEASFPPAMPLFASVDEFFGRAAAPIAAESAELEELCGALEPAMGDAITEAGTCASTPVFDLPAAANTQPEHEAPTAAGQADGNGEQAAQQKTAAPLPPALLPYTASVPADALSAVEAAAKVMALQVAVPAPATAPSPAPTPSPIGAPSPAPAPPATTAPGPVAPAPRATPLPAGPPPAGQPPAAPVSAAVALQTVAPVPAPALPAVALGPAGLPRHWESPVWELPTEAPSLGAHHPVVLGMIALASCAAASIGLKLVGYGIRHFRRNRE